MSRRQKLAPCLLADSGFVLHVHYGPAPRLQEIRFDDLLQLLTAALGHRTDLSAVLNHV
jgi:hypothetical protein